MRVHNEPPKIVQPVGYLSSIKDAPTVHIIHILDRSGSMGFGQKPSKFQVAVEGMQTEIEELKTDTTGAKHTYTVVAFSSTVSEICMKSDPEKVHLELGYPAGNTAMYDAIGDTLSNFICDDTDAVLVKIFTDGRENDSRKWKASEIEHLISECEDKGWMVTFVGTHKDVEDVIKDLGIDASNTLGYDGSAIELAMTYKMSSSARTEYSKSVVSGERKTRGFFKEIKK